LLQCVNTYCLPYCWKYYTLQDKETEEGEEEEEEEINHNNGIAITIDETIVGLNHGERRRDRKRHYLVNTTTTVTTTTTTTTSTTTLHRKRRLFNSTEYVSNTMIDLTILVTFGFLFPPLGMIGCISMCLEHVWKLVSIGRMFFIFEDNLSFQQQSIRIGLQEELLLLQDSFHKACWKMLLFVIPCMWALFVFDIMGGEVGSSNSAWWIFVLILIGLPVSVNLLQCLVDRRSSKYHEEQSTTTEDEKEKDVNNSSDTMIARQDLFNDNQKKKKKKNENEKKTALKTEGIEMQLRETFSS
jgi:hypothetical protein